MSLFVWKHQVDEMVHEATQLIKDQICILLELYSLFLFLSLHDAFQAFDAFFEYI